ASFRGGIAAGPGARARDGTWLILGGDQIGRDLLTRVLYGGRTSFAVGAVAVVAAGIIGAVVGLVSGYFGGWPDAALQRMMDSMSAIPGIVFATVVVLVIGGG